MKLTSNISKAEQFSLGLKQWIIVSCIFATLLLFVRVICTADTQFSFMLWNLFLGIIPYLITEALWKKFRLLSKVKIILILLAWLIMIPNSFYILTDLFHLTKESSIPKWFDLLLLLSFAWNGILFGILSLRKAGMIIETISGRNFSIALVFFVMWLNAFGIYIGRFLRYNSWDIVMQPFALFSSMLDILLHPINYKMEWGMVSCYAVFMTLLYVTISKLTEIFNQRIDHST